MSNEKMKPCPFCGSIAYMAHRKKSAGSQFHCVCSNKYCIASEKSVFGKYYWTESDAADAWNRRVNDDKPRKD